MSIGKKGKARTNILRDMKNSTLKLNRKQERRQQTRKSYQKNEYDKPLGET